jgi:hypothetical protein
MVTIEHKQSKRTVYQGSPHNFEVKKFEIIEDMIVTIITSFR